jgi:hypothetical protein
VVILASSADGDECNLLGDLIELNSNFLPFVSIDFFVRCSDCMESYIVVNPELIPLSFMYDVRFLIEYTD